MLICYTHLKYKIRNAWKWERIRAKTNLRMIDLRNPFKNVEIALSSEKAKEGSSRLYHKSKRLKNIWKTSYFSPCLFHIVTYNHILEDLGQWDLFDLLLNMRQATAVSNRWVFFVNIEILFCLNVILLFSHQDKLPFFKPLPTTMNHQQCRQGTPTEVVVLVLCLSINVYMFMLNVCVLCNVMCISDVCTFFDCQVPISNSAMRGDCKWNLRMRNRSIWGWERYKDYYLCTDTIWISVFYFNISRNVKCTQYQSILIPHSY